MFELKRNCPKCNKEIVLKGKNLCNLKCNYNRAEKKKSLCMSCASTGHKGTPCSDENKKKASERMKKMRNTPEFIEKYLKSRTSDEVRKKHLDSIRTPEYRKKMSASILKARTNPVFVKNHKESLNRLDVIQKMSDNTTRSWNTPSIKKKYIESMSKTKWLKVRTDVGQLEMLEKWNRLGFKFEPNYQLHTDEVLYYLDGYDKEHNVVFEYDSKYHNNQKEKDLIRQNKIIELLHPKKFWRYNAVNQTWKNVIGGNCVS